jgi:hypothetical protein
MQVAWKPIVAEGFDSHAGSDGNPQAMPSAAEGKPALSPELARRFLALVEDVTDELMQGRDVDRHACRADAIALLVATGERLDGAAAGGESPLMYLLLEEQRKMSALLGRAESPAQAPGLLKV